MSKRHFEFVEGTSSKFWEIWVEGTQVKTRYGRIGADGTTTVKDEGSAEKAQKLHDKLVAEKTKKGYVESGGAAPAKEKKASAPAGEFDDAIARIEKKAAKAEVDLNAGASPEAIAKTELALGRTLPAEVRAFYLRHDGAEGDEAIDGREFLSLERIVGEWKIWRDLLEKGDFGANNHSEPGPGVQQRWSIWEWIPVTYDGAGNHHVLDLAPGKGGTYGQVLSFWHDEGSRNVEGKGFLAWLEKVSWGSADDDEDA